MDDEQKNLRNNFIKELRSDSAYKEGRELIVFLGTFSKAIWIVLITISIPTFIFSFSIMITSDDRFVTKHDLIMLTSVITLIFAVFIRFSAKIALLTCEAIFDALDIMWDQNTGI